MLTLEVVLIGLDYQPIDGYEGHRDSIYLIYQL